MIEVVRAARREGEALGLSEEAIAARCEGASFRSFMKQAGLTRRRLCRVLGLTEGGVALLEQGRVSMTTTQALRIARATGIGIMMHPLDEATR